MKREPLRLSGSFEEALSDLLKVKSTAKGKAKGGKKTRKSKAVKTG